jgi:hypothetical protein
MRFLSSVGGKTRRKRVRNEKRKIREFKDKYTEK